MLARPLGRIEILARSYFYFTRIEVNGLASAPKRLPQESRCRGQTQVGLGR